MKLLLDTHVLLWYLLGDLRLTDRVREIVDAKTDLHFSIASLWEISIKVNLGKLQLNRSFQELLEELDFINAEFLPISIEDTQTYMNLPLLQQHREPFDRMLIAQAINHSLVIVSSDQAFDHYEIQRVWS